MSSHHSSRVLPSGSSSKPQDQEEKEGRDTQIPLQSFSKSSPVDQFYQPTIVAPTEGLPLHAEHRPSAGSTEAAAHTAASTAEMDRSHCINMEADESTQTPLGGDPTNVAASTESLGVSARQESLETIKLIFSGIQSARPQIIKTFLADADLGAGDHRRATTHLMHLSSKFTVPVILQNELEQSMFSESLYQQNCLLSRAKLFREFLRACCEYEQSPLRTDVETAGGDVAFRINGDEDFKKAMESHASAMEAYRGFRKDADQHVSDKNAMRLAGMLIDLEEKKNRVDQLKRASSSQRPTPERQNDISRPGDKENIQKIEADIFDLETRISLFLLAHFNIHGLIARLSSVYLAGVTLVLPIVAMSQYGGADASLVIASVSIVFVSTLVAMFMKDATPKDIMGVTAAYAAVLVVFVGANSSPELSPTQPNNATSTG